MGFPGLFLGSELMGTTQWLVLWPTLDRVYLHGMEFNCERWLEETLRGVLPGNPFHWICCSDLELNSVLPEMCLTAMERRVSCLSQRLNFLNDTQKIQEGQSYIHFSKWVYTIILVFSTLSKNRILNPLWCFNQAKLNSSQKSYE